MNSLIIQNLTNKKQISYLTFSSEKPSCAKTRGGEPGRAQV